MSEEIQAQLLARIAEEDRDALAEFYDQAAGMLFSTAVRILGDPHEAEEVILDVFVQIWDKAITFDPAAGAAIHWALSITRNRSIDRLRSRQRRARLATELAETAKADPPLDDLMKSGLAADEMAAVRTAVFSLPSDQREAIEMAFFGGLTHQDIAAKLK